MRTLVVPVAFLVAAAAPAAVAPVSAPVADLSSHPALADFDAATGLAPRSDTRFSWAEPGALRLDPSRSLESAARAALPLTAPGRALSPRALAAVETRRVKELGRRGALVALGQRFDGIEVLGAELKLLFDSGRRLVATGGALLGELPSEAPVADRFALSDRDALGSALRDLTGDAPAASSWLASAREDRFGRRFELRGNARPGAAPGTTTRAPAPAHVGHARAGRVWYPLGGALLAAYRVELFVGRESSTDSDAYSYVVSAANGRILRRRNLTQSEAFTYRVWARPVGSLKPEDGPLDDVTPHPTGIPDDTVPGGAPSSLISVEGLNHDPSGGTDPWLAPGAVSTRGNNVDAYSDFVAPDGFNSGDLRATTTSAGVFDRAYDLAAEPLATARQTRAAITQLFYTTNWLHDDWYDSGFDEEAGNAQTSNYGRGGISGDQLHAEAQDGALAGSRNNANMMTPEDGVSPRMQMFLWRSPFDASVATSIDATPLEASRATYGPAEFDLGGAVALANDGFGNSSDGCQPLSAGVAGKIALVDFGVCGSVQKVANAQAAHAVGVLVAGTTPGAPPPGLSGTNSSIVIPTLSITYEAGAEIKSALAAGAVSATLHLTSGIERSGELDNLVVAHEWGHMLHHRLVECGSRQCAAESEGWGDFVALHLAVRDGDPTATGTYASAVYAPLGPFHDAAYFGLRRYPYSRDRNRNPLRFRHISDGETLPSGPPLNPKSSQNSEVHNAGEVWASMLLDAYGALLDRHSFAEARRRMSDYVVVGMELAPVDPTYTEQRDALLAAAAAVDAGDLQAMAQGFALRGAGSCAVSPPRDSTDLQGVVEDDTRARSRVAIESVTLAPLPGSCDGDATLDAGESGTVRVRVRNTGTVALPGFVLQLHASPPGLSFANGGVVAGPPLAPFAATELTLGVAASPNLIGAPLVAVAATAGGAALCESVNGGLATFVNYDPRASADDSASLATAWNETGTAAGIWRRIVDPADAANLLFAASDSSFNSDVRFESPPLQVSPGAPFVVSFSHRHSFETSDGVLWDGGVVEYSTDGGASWSDVSNLTSPGYGGTLTDISHNPLGLRPAYVARNPSWPARETVVLSFGASLAGQTVRLRFRLGTDDAAGDTGWEIDDVTASGLVNLPFLALAANAHPCAGAAIFSDGFGSGNTSFWSAASGL